MATLMRLIVWLRLYRPLMKLAHRFDWHYAPPIYPEGDTQLWCQWCGLRQTVKRRVLREPPLPMSIAQVKARAGNPRTGD